MCWLCKVLRVRKETQGAECAEWQLGKCCSFLFKEYCYSLLKCNMQDLSHEVLKCGKKGGEVYFPVTCDFYIKHFLRTN